jgi:hypothetical protein
MARFRTSLIITSVALSAAGIARASETIIYTYDTKGRLILVQHSGTVNNNVTVNYTLDTADNRKNIKVIGAP